MIKFAVYAEIVSGRENEFLDALRAYLPAVREEPGTLQYDVCRGNDNPSAFLFFEAYPDEAAQRAHTESDAFKVYMDSIKPLLASAPQGMQLIESAKA